MPSQIHQDLMYLAGRLLHRSAQSECERDAAEYIERRFKEHTPEVSSESFFCIENYPYLFASYFSEFLVVGILSIYWPLMAFLYGGAVFIFYFMEFSGFRGLSRFMPQYPSQNVVARFQAVRPRSLIVVTAHYDSGCASPLTSPAVIPWLRLLNYVVIAAMVIVLATCVSDFIAVRNGASGEMAMAVRALAIGILMAGALALFMASSRGEDIRGANGNASGVAALLGLADSLGRDQPEDADVWLVATGSHESWMGGMRQFLAEHHLDRANTYILNLEGIGAGEPHVLTKEGMLHVLRANPDMLRHARALADAHGIREGVMRAVPTEAHVPLMREMNAMTVMGLDEEGLPPHWNQISDRVTEVEEKTIAQVTNFADAFIRVLAREHAQGESGNG